MKMYWNAPKWHGKPQWVTVSKFGATHADAVDANERKLLIPLEQLAETGPATERDCQRMEDARERDEDANWDDYATRNQE